MKIVNLRISKKILTLATSAVLAGTSVGVFALQNNPKPMENTPAVARTEAEAELSPTESTTVKPEPEAPAQSTVTEKEVTPVTQPQPKILLDVSGKSDSESTQVWLEPFYAPNLWKYTLTYQNCPAVSEGDMTISSTALLNQRGSVVGYHVSKISSGTFTSAALAGSEYKFGFYVKMMPGTNCTWRVVAQEV